MNTGIFAVAQEVGAGHHRAAAVGAEACARVGAWALLLALLALSGCGPSEPVVGQQRAADAEVAADGSGNGGDNADVSTAGSGASGVSGSGEAGDVQATSDIAPLENSGPIAPDASGPDAGESAGGGNALDPTTPLPPTTPAPFAASKTAPEGFAVHEWGTFTSMQGSDGVSLDGLHHEEEALPKFVYGRSKAAMMMKQIESLPEPCNQKMETPVVYFHTPLALDVALTVDFPKGIISQWFPGVASFAPEPGALKNSQSPNATHKHLAGGSMTWHVSVDPKRSMAAAPKVQPDSVWQPSRNTNAAPVRAVVGPQYNAGSPVDETERFLFYRGLGRFTLPVRIAAGGEGKLTVHNDGDLPLPHVVVLQTVVSEQGVVTGGVATYGTIAANASKATPIPAATMSQQAAMAAAKSALKKGIVAFGLNDDEAQAMVDTWQQSWFATPGVRVLYVLPQPWTEELLPMKVSPKPDKLVRVLVGRIEVLTPEDEAADVNTVQSALINGTKWWKLAIDRFAEPRVRRACALLGEKAKTYCAAAIKGLESQK